VVAADVPVLVVEVAAVAEEVTAVGDRDQLTEGVDAILAARCWRS
jgi:hypothetical protein